MKVSEMFPSKWLKPVDLKTPNVTVEIAKLTQETVGARQDVRWVIWFVGCTKGLILSKDTAYAIADQYGDTENWPGKKVTLFGGYSKYQGEDVPAVKVRPRGYVQKP